MLNIVRESFWNFSVNRIYYSLFKLFNINTIIEFFIYLILLILINNKYILAILH